MLNLLIESWPFALFGLSTGTVIAMLLRRTAKLKELLSNQRNENKNLESRLVLTNNGLTALQEKLVNVNSQWARIDKKVSRTPDLEIKIEGGEQRLTKNQALLSKAHQNDKVLETQLNNARTAV